MKVHGIITKPGTIRFERLLPGPIEKVWAYLTESEKKAKWLAGGDVEPRVNGKVELIFQHKNLSEKDVPIPEKYKNMEDGSYFTGRVKTFEPPKLLCYSWGEDNGEESEVTFELIPKENNRVLLILTHRRLGDDKDILISVASGWHTHLGILADRLNSKQPQGFWKVHNRLEQDYEVIISK